MMDRLLAGKSGAGMDHIFGMQPAAAGYIPGRSPHRHAIHRDDLPSGEIAGRQFMLRRNGFAHRTGRPIQCDLRASVKWPESDHGIVRRVKAEDGMHVCV
jgi:hypothetical protein